MNRLKYKNIVPKLLLFIIIIFSFMLFPNNKIKELEEKLKTFEGKERVRVLLDLAVEYKDKNPDVRSIAAKALKKIEGRG